MRSERRHPPLYKSIDRTIDVHHAQILLPGIQRVWYRSSIASQYCGGRIRSKGEAEAMMEQGGETEAQALAWYMGEFAASNAIIDELCRHLRQIGPPGLYGDLFAAIYRRRLNWLPALHFQKFFSIAEVIFELQKLVQKYPKEEASEKPPEASSSSSSSSSSSTAAAAATAAETVTSGDSFQEDHSSVENASLICSDHEECNNRREKIKISKGFMIKEQIKGHMVNVVKGLKVFEEVFTVSQLAKLQELMNDLRTAGRNGELSGGTFIFFNKELKGNKREIIQFGVPIFQHTTDEEAANIEPIPAVLQDVIDHLVQWHLISPSKKPNSCMINFFDEGDHSQPYSKPPHLDHPISTLVLNETTMVFGRALMSDNQGSYKGSLNLTLKEGSLVVMRGHSADVARHVICPTNNSRVAVTFAKVRQRPPNQPSNSSAMNATASFVPQALVPAWGIPFQPPVIMVPPPQAPPSTSMDTSASNKAGYGGNGTGVFLPWTMGSKKYIKQLPPRIQKKKLPLLPPLLRMQVDQAMAPLSFSCT